MVSEEVPVPPETVQLPKRGTFREYECSYRKKRQDENDGEWAAANGIRNDGEPPNLGIRITRKGQQGANFWRIHPFSLRR